MIKITARGREKISFFMQGRDLLHWALRVKEKGKGQFAFSLEEVQKSAPSDQIFEWEGFKVVADRLTASQIEGGEIDFLDTGKAVGFRINLPERPVQAGPRGGPDLANPQIKKVHEILANEINPALASHGGMAKVIDVKDNVAYLQFGGGCHGCGMVDVTLKQGVEARIKELMPEIVAVRDATDHSTGTEPYFK